MQTGFDFDVSYELEYIPCDLENIVQTLPQLYAEQQEDVFRIEKRFQVGKGYLCTNGTGTGKTFVGLGVAKRFQIQDKINGLIVVPTEQKSKDWIEEGRHLSLDITMLKDVKDKGRGIVVTTYSNFYQNESLLERIFDYIIYDECHYLNQNSKGKETVYMEQHRKLALLPSAARERAVYEAGPYPESDDIDFHFKKQAWLEFVDRRMREYEAMTKVLLLSATPFAYHKSLTLGDGLIFDINEVFDKEDEVYGYNVPTGFDKFLCDHFGYRMRSGKCTIPETGVDVDLLERQFFEKHRDLGVMSTRVLELPFDYSRDFVILDSKIGRKIDEGIEMFYKQDFKDKYKYLSAIASRQFSYRFMNQLIECIKAREVIPRISHHLLLGRKIVIFHSYNNTTMWHPFRFNFDKLLNPEDSYYFRNQLEKEMEIFRHEYPEYYNLNLSGLDNVPNTIKKYFPHAELFNGTVPKKKRKFYKDIFCQDYSEIDIFVLQTKAGREGISLHDQTGIHQRTIINLGLPVQPSQAIQEEGRIYRSGLMSNSCYEYATIHTNFERFAFATKIAERAKTVENLAMGNLARDLERAFKDGYIEASDNLPSIHQGVGGKENDRKIHTSSDFERAITYYYSNLKKTTKNKSSEGVDYYATPEPLGLRMLEWCNPQPDKYILEPSAGHGAIGRWFPSNCNNVFIEPSYELASMLSINVTGDIKIEPFEHFNIMNKFDYILMNPPFGNRGATAMAHIQKACVHLRNHVDSKLYAIVPDGPSMDKRLEEFYDSREFRNLHLAGELILPAVTFNRAGTSVRCKIIKIVAKGFINHRDLTPQNLEYNKIDLSYINEISEFFEAIKNLEF